MSEPEFHLDAVQRWMQAVITHPDGVEAGLQSEGAREHLDVPAESVEQVVGRSQSLTSVERLGIYAGAYYARLLECLGEEFPILKQTLGDEAFDGFAFAYLQSYPSRSYTLTKLGENFAKFLAETRPDPEEWNGETAGDAVGPEFPEFLVDLAMLEWTFAKVFDGPGVEGQPLLDIEELQRIDPEVWPAARLETVPCLKLLTFRFPLNDYYSAIRRKETPPPPDAAPTWLAVTRRDFVVRRHELTGRQFALLSALQTGESVGAAIERALQVPGDDLSAFAIQLRDWFQIWSAEGLFQRVVLPGVSG